MSSPCPPRAPPAPPLEFSRIFHALDTLRAHIESLQHYLELVVQQQWQQYQAQISLTPDQPSQKGPLHSTGPSPSILPSPKTSGTLAPSSAEQDSETRAHLMMIRRVYNPLPHHGVMQSSAVSLLQSRPHPHVYGHGYVQAQSYPSSQAQQQILSQINTAREAIGTAKRELNHVIEEVVRC